MKLIQKIPEERQWDGILNWFTSGINDGSLETING